MIKPEDIPDQVVRKILLDDTYENVVAAILNAAIEAGLVVPANEANVLRRALELATKFISTVDDDYDTKPEPWIDQARRELESEEAK